MGIRQGKYRPQKVPQFARSEDSFLDKSLEKIAAELENQIIREIANRVYNNISKNEAILDNLAKAVTTNIIIKNLYSNLEGSVL
jgi:hypothetical protein